MNLKRVTLVNEQRVEGEYEPLIEELAGQVEYLGRVRQELEASLAQTSQRLQQASQVLQANERQIAELRGRLTAGEETVLDGDELVS